MTKHSLRIVGKAAPDEIGIVIAELLLEGAVVVVELSFDAVQVRSIRVAARLRVRMGDELKKCNWESANSS